MKDTLIQAGLVIGYVLIGLGVVILVWGAR
jgi:hypothetical protein